MARQRNTILILGEGPTEFYYFKSLGDVFRGLTVKPDYPKHTNLNELKGKIAEGIREGYSHIFCVVDMDTKCNDAERKQYQQLKDRYAKPVDKPSKGIHCEVRFFETHRCTELFFLYYFCYTSKGFINQDSLIKEINQHCKYEKSTRFFRECGGLHPHFERSGGSLLSAIRNANQSVAERNATNRAYTYSELGSMIEAIKEARSDI